MRRRLIQRICVLYDTPETITSFHRNFGFDGNGMISDLGADLVTASYV